MKKTMVLKQMLTVFLLGTWFASFAQTANVQIIHNCAAPAADTVDIYVNGTLALPSVAFRTATGFINLPSGVALSVVVATKHSTGLADSIKSFTVGPLASDSNYVVIASGIAGAGFAANPNSLSTAFTLNVIANAKTSAPAGNVNLAIFHGVTDAPGVDVKITGGATLATNLEYGSYAGYLTVPATWYPISIYPTGTNTAVANYLADLSSLGGGAAVVLASGFLTPSMNNNGPAFALIAVLANGTVITLPTQTFANIQVIHNSAAPAADSVDVYIDGAKALNSFKFRSATPFINLLASVKHTITVAAPNSASIADSIKSFTAGPLAADSNYVVIASGIVGSGFAANPNSLSTAFTLNVIANAKISAPSGNVNLAIFHGATDAPGVDIKITGGSALATNLQYGSHAGYLTVPATWYPISIYPTGTNTAVANYLADISSLDGGAAVVLASGFLTPSMNNNGPAFALIAVLTNGTVITLPAQTFANVQIAHNCAAPGADSVDVYLDGSKAISNFKFRTATPFIKVLSGVNHTVAVAPPNSTSVTQAIATFDSINLAANANYVVVASGVVGNGFASNPSGISTAFKLDVIPNAQTVSTNSSNVDLAIFHGATDAPAVSVVVQGGATLVQGLQYAHSTPYVSVPAGNYIIEIKDSSESSVIASYSANVTGLADSAGVVYASGFLTPASNNNGPAFGLYLSLPSGGPFIPLSVYTGIERLSNNVMLQLFPNPASNQITAKFSLAEVGSVTIDITDLNGQVVEKVANGNLSGSQELEINTNQLSNGMYFLRINNGGNLSVNKFLVVR